MEKVKKKVVKKKVTKKKLPVKRKVVVKSKKLNMSETSEEVKKETIVEVTPPIIEYTYNNTTDPVKAGPLGSKAIQIKFKNSYGSTTQCNMWTCDAPTNNCQVGSIASFANFISLINPENYLRVFKEIITKYVMRNMILIDVRQDTPLLSTFEKIFQPYIVFKKDYTSTRGSAMCMFLLDVRQIYSMKF